MYSQDKKRIVALHITPNWGPTLSQGQDKKRIVALHITPNWGPTLSQGPKNQSRHYLVPQRKLRTPK